MYWFLTVLMIFIFPIAGAVMLAAGLLFNLLVNVIDAIHAERNRKQRASRRKYA